MLALKACDRKLVFAYRPAATVSTGKCACSVWSAAGNLVHVSEAWFRIWSPHNDHAEMQQRGVKAGDRGLLSTMLRAG